MTGDALIHDISSTQLDKGHMAFWWIGQIGFAYKLARRMIYVNPYRWEA